jgi:fido (protein-threonine AMPylation protein)
MDKKKTELFFRHQRLFFNGRECHMMNIRDLTEQQKLEQAQNQNTYLNALTANVSHEMMVPLNCIILFAVHLVIAC